MEYVLRAECDVCGKTVGLVGITGKDGKIEINILDVFQKAGLRHIKGHNKRVCQNCYVEYNKLRQHHKTEIENFFKGEKKQEG